ncbi:MAG: universal stress protein [Bacteroidetes bacterium]|nr:universal stress protein [Bacteroidota bacterium]
MKTFHILVPTDFSECADLAFEHGIYLANKFEGELHLLHVAELPTITLPDFPADLFEVARSQGMSRMRDMIERQELQLPPIKRVVMAGTPAEPAADVVVDYAKANGVDFIVMGTHGRRGARRLFLGSVTEEVARRAPCPVLTVRAGRKAWPLPRVERILVPVDFGDSTRDVVGSATRMAEHYDAAVTLLHVVDLEFYPYYGFGSDPYPMVERDLMDASERKLTDLAAEMQAAGIVTTWLTEKGHPAATIREVADRRDVDLIVIGSHGRSGLDRALMGSVSEKVLRTVHCPVLVMHTTDKEIPKKTERREMALLMEG